MHRTRTTFSLSKLEIVLREINLMQSNVMICVLIEEMAQLKEELHETRSRGDSNHHSMDYVPDVHVFNKGLDLYYERLYI